MYIYIYIYTNMKRGLHVAPVRLIYIIRVSNTCSFSPLLYSLTSIQKKNYWSSIEI